MNRFGEFLYELRKKKGYTQAELADIIGVSNRTVSMWETGNNYPDTAVLIALSEIFDVTVDELLKGERRGTSEVACMAEICAEECGEAVLPDSEKLRKYKKLFTTAGVTLFLSIALLLLFMGMAMAGSGRGFSGGDILSSIIYFLDITAIGVGVALLVYAVGKRREAYSGVTEIGYIKKFRSHMRYTAILHFVMLFMLAIFAAIGLSIELSTSPLDGITIALIALEIITAALLIAEALRWDGRAIKKRRSERDTSYKGAIIASSIMFGVYVVLTVVTLAVTLAVSMPLWLYILFTVTSLFLNGGVFVLSVVFLTKKRKARD